MLDINRCGSINNDLWPRLIRREYSCDDLCNVLARDGILDYSIPRTVTAAVFPQASLHPK